MQAAMSTVPCVLRNIPVASLHTDVVDCTLADNITEWKPMIVATQVSDFLAAQKKRESRHETSVIAYQMVCTNK